MKTKILSLAVLSILSFTSVFAQDRTTVTANNSEISDNLDLRAVASIFGESTNLGDFERRLNDSGNQISNLDLNGDNKVDYLRVIETVEGNTHLIVIQSVLGNDTFQDIATVEVERDRYNKVQVQVVGDSYMYGDNYIYEPVYANTPIIYTSFWVNTYHPYYSSWYWGYYPSFYIAWSPCPIYRYRNHIGIYINTYNNYNYVNYRRCQVAYNSYYSGGRRGNGYEREYPNRSFEHRNNGYANTYELDNSRRTQNSNTRNEVINNGTRNNSNSVGSPRNIRTQNGLGGERAESTPRTYGNVRTQESPRTVTTQISPRNVRSESIPRSQESPRSIATQNGYGNERSESTPRGFGNQRSQESPRSVTAQNGYGNQRSQESPRNSSPREFSQQRGNSQRTQGNSGGNRRS